VTRDRSSCTGRTPIVIHPFHGESNSPKIDISPTVRHHVGGQLLVEIAIGRRQWLFRTVPLLAKDKRTGIRK
jgi:hypothetical protein